MLSTRSRHRVSDLESWNERAYFHHPVVFQSSLPTYNEAVFSNNFPPPNLQASTNVISETIISGLQAKKCSKNYFNYYLNSI